MVEKRTVTFIALALLVWSIAATFFMGYYYISYTSLMKAIGGTPVKLDILIDYGNETQRWYNGSVFFANSTVFDALLSVTKDVNFETGTWGTLVTAINRVENAIETQTATQITGWAWLWYYWGTEESRWEYGPEASDRYFLGRLGPYGAILWRYEQYSYTL